MAECGQKAVLIVTRTLEGTATNIVRERHELRCELAEGHSGPHRDEQRNAEWSATPGQFRTLLRHEDEV